MLEVEGLWFREPQLSVVRLAAEPNYRIARFRLAFKIFRLELEKYTPYHTSSIE